MDSAGVDVIILSWNRAAETIEAVRSVTEQEGIASCIYVVDQGSEPEQLRRLEAYLSTVPTVRLKKLGANCGVAEGRNIASSMGSAPIIVALDNDAVFADRFALARAVRELETDPRLCALAFRIENFFTRLPDQMCWIFESPDAAPEKSFEVTTFVGGGYAVRRKTFEAVGGYDGKLFFCGEEIDLCYRMLNTGARIRYQPSIVVLHKVSPERRIDWNKGRYFYSVRNTLYTRYKFGVPVNTLASGAAAMILRGWSNGMVAVPIQAVLAAVRMSVEFRRSGADRHVYRLTPETWEFIREREPARDDPFLVKLRRQFLRLPSSS